MLKYRNQKCSQAWHKTGTPLCCHSVPAQGQRWAGCSWLSALTGCPALRQFFSTTGQCADAIEWSNKSCLSNYYLKNLSQNEHGISVNLVDCMSTYINGPFTYRLTQIWIRFFKKKLHYWYPKATKGPGEVLQGLHSLNPPSSFWEMRWCKTNLSNQGNQKLRAKICFLASTFWSFVFNCCMADVSMRLSWQSHWMFRCECHELVLFIIEDYIIFQILYILWSCHFKNSTLLNTQSGFCQKL